MISYTIMTHRDSLGRLVLCIPVKGHRGPETAANSGIMAGPRVRGRAREPVKEERLHGAVHFLEGSAPQLGELPEAVRALPLALSAV